jgi:hypothetical protein
VNRDERRRLARAGHKTEHPPTQADGKRFIDEAFRDRISWTAARVLLERARPLLGPGSYDAGEIDEVAAAIDRFLERHPAPATRE